MMLRIFCSITGDDYKLVKVSDPISRKKISLMATLLMVPTIMWLVNGFLISRMVLNYDLTISLITGLGCALVIFIIERALLHAKGMSVNFFRIALGLLVAVIGSIGWDEVIFQQDIDNHMMVYQENIKKKEVKKKTGKLSEMIKQKEIETRNAYEDWQEASLEANKEADGTGGSGIRGVSEITKIKIQAAEELKNIYMNYKKELDQLQHDLKEKEKEYAKNFEQEFNEHSLLTRIKVLFDMVFSDNYMLIPYLLITLLLVVLEFLVIIYKILSPQSAYDYRVEAMQKTALNRINMLSSHDHTARDPFQTDNHYLQMLRRTNSSSARIFDD